LEILKMGCVSLLLSLVEGKGVKSWSFRHVAEDRRGVTAIEYGLIAALIAIAAIVMMQSVGTNLTSTFSNVASNL
jgi:pilus assembly protein Flp/PilA